MYPRNLCSLLIVALILIFATPAWSSKEEAGAGVVYGPGHAYKLGAPKGWIFDNESGRGQGLHAVIYPAGESWRESKVVAYSGVTQKDGGSLQSVIDDDEKKFRLNSPNLIVEELPALKTSDDRTAIVRKFRGDTFGNYELVAYIDTPEVVCQIVLSARNEESFTLGESAFSHIVGSFKFLAVDSDRYIESGDWRQELQP